LWALGPCGFIRFIRFLFVGYFGCFCVFRSVLHFFNKTFLRKKKKKKKKIKDKLW